MANIPNKSDGQVFNASEIFKIVGSSTGGSSSSTSETTLATITIAANQVSTAIIIIGSIRFNGLDSGGSSTTGTFKLKIGATSSEATVQTQTLKSGEHGVGGINSTIGGCILYVDSSQTWSSEVTILLTVQNTDTEASCFVHGLVAIGV